jgi:predicted RNA-binding Zn-ribbon protein involved in translation (DUF1610 family)
MAEGLRYVCQGCDHAIEAWSDGNPYFIDETGTKQYAYHPDHDLLDRCIGNDTPHLCLSCGHELMVDSRAPVSTCTKCGAHKLVDTYQMSGCLCPYCKEGLFAVDPAFHSIS